MSESNVLFLWDNAADAGSISATSEVSDMPATNLLDPQRSRVWRSTDGGDQDVDLTLASDEDTPIGAVAVVDHVLGPNGTIRARAYSDSLGGTLEVDVTIEAWEAMYGYGVGGYGQGGYGGVPASDVRTLVRPVTFVPLPDYVDHRYWRLTFSDPDVSYHQAGRIYVGGLWQPRYNMSWGWRQLRRSRTRYTKTRGGQRYGNPRQGRAALDMALDHLGDEDRDRILMAWAALEDHTPFIVCARPVGGIEQLMTALYCHFPSDLDMEMTRLNQNRASLELMEEL